MFVKDVKVENQVGLHARPATFFIQKANEFKSSIWVEKEERRVNAKSLLGVLSLGIMGGTDIRIIADGSDEEAALSKLMEEQDKKVAEFQELNEKRQTEERGKLLESIQVATNNLAKAKGYTYVLDANSVVFAVDGKDITEDVLKSIPATEKAAPTKTEEKK